jgi:glycosyltransferase involved in cell wall biosynthesis
MVSHTFPPVVSGVSLVVQKLARAMVQRGHSVTVIAGSDRPEPYSDDDEGVRLVRVRGVKNPVWEEAPIPVITQKDFDEIADDVQPDILHAHEAALLCLRLLRLKRDTCLPLLATCYYVPRFLARYLTWNDEPQATVEASVWSYSIWLFNQLDHVVFATSAHRKYFVEQGLDVPTSIISNGLDVTRYRPGGDGIERVEARYALPPRPRILFVSRLAKDKEIDLLVRAMPYVRATQDAHLLLVGRGDERHRLEDLVGQSGLGHCVHFLGFVPEEDMPALYRASDLFAIASECEVQSLPTLQAVATGLPVVAADAVALPELVHDGANGFLVPPGDPEAVARAILRVLGDSAMAGRMGRAGLSIAQPHAETRTFDRYENLYYQLLNAK